jgi:tetratricopeptide (TPR) repeat protein
MNRFFVFLFFLIFLSGFSFLIYFSFNTEFKNNISEKVFLEYNQNKLALRILYFLETNNNTNFYTYFLKGRIHFVEGEYYESIENYTKAIELNNSYKESYYGRGLNYGFVGGQFLPLAEEDFKKYIELDNILFEKTGYHAYGAWAGYNDLAWIYFLMNDFKKQEEVARKGISFSSSNPWLLNTLGVALLAQEKCTEAAPYLENAKKFINETSVKEFGEAYSGDKREFWSYGLESMKGVIVDNLETCKK